jgi:hypothetical protein
MFVVLLGGGINYGLLWLWLASLGQFHYIQLRKLIDPDMYHYMYDIRDPQIANSAYEAFKVYWHNELFLKS